MNKYILYFFLISLTYSYAQETKDTLVPKGLNEVVVVGKKTKLNEKQAKPLASIDQFLLQGTKVGMIKRGAYAWEPMINSMSTERTLITIDGMRIFGACTDKMDPVTSYVEVSNLSEATICSGQEGTCYGSTIGGALDMKRNQNTFGEKRWDVGVNSGFETNNKQIIVGAALNYSDTSFYFDSNFMLRDAENYFAGNKNEVQFSQFRKLNFSGTSGFKFDTNKLLEGSVIYDKATNVGYPALPMDVSLAEALITSLKFEYIPVNSFFKKSETKLYFNTITHLMDDTQRPNVEIHMDMPGWSKTAGFYSKWDADYNEHHFLFNLNSFYNQSLATMTMYPNDPNEPSMFMYTWPDVRTFYTGVFVQDDYVLNCHSSIRFSAAVGGHSNNVANDMGLESLRIFYPDMEATNSRFVKSISSNYNVNHNGLEYGLGLGYGDRAPSVSEGYGFYLFNSFDYYDYIGNPGLKNESSSEFNAYLGMKKAKWSAKINSSYFHLSNYIVGVTDSSLIPMTIGANGVKVYTALDYATLYNIGLTAEIKLAEQFNWNSQVLYTRGKDFKNVNLPFISPLSYSSAIRYFKDKISAEVSVQGNAVQTNFSPTYGEDRTPDYAILNASFGYKFLFGRNKLLAKLGVENMLDAYYSTYSDWNNIPRMGRNFFINLNYSLQ